MPACCRSGSRITSSSSATSPRAGWLKWTDVDYDANDAAVRIRREMEAAFGQRGQQKWEPVLRPAARL